MVSVSGSDPEATLRRIFGASYDALTIFPLHPPPDHKHPAVKWGDSFPDHGKQFWVNGHGLATGSRSGGIVVIDIDAKNGKDGFSSLARMELQIGELPPTLTVDSRSGGAHLYYRSSIEVGSPTDALGMIGVDVRGEKGYIVLPTSPGYVAREGRGETMEIATLPGPWAARLRAPRRPPPVAVHSSSPVDVLELRARLEDTVKGRRGAVWAAWRAIARGERFFDFEDPARPAVHTWIRCRMIPALLRADGWLDVCGESIAEVAEPALSIFRLDAGAFGTESRWTFDYFAAQWEQARPHAAAEIQENEALVRALAEHQDRMTANRTDTMNRGAR